MIDIFQSKFKDEEEQEEMRKKCPLLMKLINNGIQHKYSECALVTLEDLDTGDAKWFLTSIVGNLKSNNLQDILCEQTLQTSKIVLEKTGKLCNELPATGPSKIKRFLRKSGKFLFYVTLALVSKNNTGKNY